MVFQLRFSCYTIDGREVKKSCLKHGVYIRDGKKVRL